MNRITYVAVCLACFLFCFNASESLAAGSAKALTPVDMEAHFHADDLKNTSEGKSARDTEGGAQKRLSADMDEWFDHDVHTEIKITEAFYYHMLINLVAVFLLIMLVYYPGNRKPDQIFTFILFNIIIFVITYVLNQVKFSMGAAFGLFAVFTMLRYRTRTITMKDMTYLFIFIALGLINAVQLRYDVMLVLNAFVILVTWVMDSNLIFKQESSKSIQYDQIEMIRPENHEALIKDLRERTGLEITRFEIRRVNFLRDTARLTVYYRERPGGIYSRINNGNRDKNEESDV